jgi:serine phosphatase RsbU (regulator of sigma subunit)
MSILGITFMNEIVASDVPVSPGELLNQLRDHVIKTLHQSQNEKSSRSGIDMALCVFDTDRDILSFSGAFRPLYMIRNGHLNEIAGDNMTVGLYDEVENPFTTREIKLMQGDAIYLFTDGYVDQIGGANRKTLKTGKFKEILLRISELPMDEQKKLLETSLSDWKGDFSQVDDILVIGIRYSKI